MPGAQVGPMHTRRWPSAYQRDTVRTTTTVLTSTGHRYTLR